MQAIILAGGLGTRLRDVVPDVPKPLAPVGGRPFLTILLERLSAQGFATVVLAVGYRHELIRAAFGDRFDGVELRYVVEDKPLGTGGAMRRAARECSDTDVFVLNGDSFTELDYAELLARHRDANSGITVCTVAVADTTRYGRVLVEGARITGFAEKGVPGPGLINAGVYLMRRELLEAMVLPEVFSFEQDVLAAYVAELRPLAFLARGLFIDIGIPADYARARVLFARS